VESRCGQAAASELGTDGPDLVTCTPAASHGPVQSSLFRVQTVHPVRFSDARVYLNSETLVCLFLSASVMQSALDPKHLPTGHVVW
jgi:hypothetical protein